MTETTNCIIYYFIFARNSHNEPLVYKHVRSQNSKKPLWRRHYGMFGGKTHPGARNKRSQKIFKNGSWYREGKSLYMRVLNDSETGDRDVASKCIAVGYTSMADAIEEMALLDYETEEPEIVAIDSRDILSLAREIPGRQITFIIVPSTTTPSL